MNDARFAREQRRGENGQRRILRAADLDGTRKRMTAVNEDLIHTWQKGTVSYLNNRFLNKCRGNFFPPRPKEALRPGRPQFPGPAFRLGEAACGTAQSICPPIRPRAGRRKARPPDRVRLHVKARVDLALRY